MLTLLAPVLLSLAPVAPDSWAPPSKVVGYSSDGKWMVTVTPGKCTACGPHHTGKHTAPHATASLRGPDGTREFELLHPLMPVAVKPSCDGDLYCFDHWGQMGQGKCAVRYDAQGTLQWERTLEELLPADRLKQVPQSVSSRSWLRHPERIVEEEGAILVSIWNGDRLRLDRVTGAAEYVVVTDHGDDAWGWYLMALDRMNRGQLDEALEPLDRAVDLDLDRVDGYERLAYLKGLKGTPRARIEVLRYAIERTAEREAEGRDPRRGLRYQLATALVEVDEGKEARELLEDLLAADPLMDSAAAALVGLEYRAGNEARAEHWVQASYKAHYLKGMPDGRGLIEGTMTAAYLCQQAGQDQRAAEWYRLALDQGAWDDNLVQAYIALLSGTLDRPADAAHLTVQLLQRWRDQRRKAAEDQRDWWDARIADFERRKQALEERAKRR